MGHCQMTGSECKCTYNGGSTWEDSCKCGVCQPDPHCQMTGSACKCTYNGGSTWEDNCKCGVAPAPTPAPEPCVQDPHCQMTGSACKCTYNGGSTWEDNCKCGVGPALTSALVSGTEHAADQASNFRNETVKTFAQAGASCQPDPHCQMTGSECKCTYNGGSTWEDSCKCGVCQPDPHCQMTGSACKCTYNGG